MAIQIVRQVIDDLTKAGISACEAGAARELPAMTGPQAAVSLGKLDFDSRRATVHVQILSPAELGAAACETAAVQAGMRLQTMGSNCVQGNCSFNGYADAFCVEVRADFYGGAVMEEWSYSSGFTVTLDNTVLNHVTAFQAEQAVDPDTGLVLESGVWSFRLVEDFGIGQAAQPTPVDQFELMVQRSGCTETFKDCTWVSVQLETTDAGLRQVRRGVAQSRDFIAVV